MKKWHWAIIFIIGFYCSSVNAQTFNFEKNSNYQYKLTWKIGSNSATHLYLPIYKITDKAGNIFYDVEPKSTIFTSHNYESVENFFDEEKNKKIAKIIYFGYEYQNHQTLEYYVATQYLIFKTLGVDDVSILNKASESISFAKKEIEEIQKLIENHHFVSEDYMIFSPNLKIEDPYIMRYYNIEGDGISVTEEDNSYKINFLEEQEKYILHLKAKKNCLKAQYWKSASSADLIGKGDLCEEDTSFVVHLKKEALKQENLPKEEDQIETERIPIEEIEVNMPNTSKYNCIGLLLIVLIGNIYYVYKK